jgi:hypothetical protein
VVEIFQLKHLLFKIDVPPQKKKIDVKSILRQKIVMTKVLRAKAVRTKVVRTKSMAAAIWLGL